MKGKLIKRGEEDYRLFIDDSPFAQSKKSPYKKLSLKNCQAIENGYDLYELAENNYPTFNLPLTDTTAINTLKQDSFKEGFQKAIEILGDKKFSEEDVISMIEKSRETGLTSEYLILTKQQTEWDVEIEMEPYVACDLEDFINDGKTHIIETKLRHQLDSDGCLILKRK